jgi:hypothetical protein
VLTTTAAPKTERRQYDPAPLARGVLGGSSTTCWFRWGCHGARASVALLTSELVADAFRQAPTSIALNVELAGGTVRVEVSDDPGLIRDASAGQFERQIARSLVEKLASNCGSDLDRGRTTTWFSLPADDPDHDSVWLGRRDPERG